MKKNGFTLIELIATIGLLGMLATILITVSVKKINETKEHSKKTMIESIELAAKQYITDYKDELSDFQNNDYIYISLQTLVEKNYFSNSLIDPTTNKSLPLTDTVYVTREQNGEINAVYDINQKEKAKITLYGSYNEYIKEGTTFTDLGVNAISFDGTNISSSITTTGTVDTTTPGTYKIKYEYGDISIERNVIVYEGNLPSEADIPVYINYNANEGAFSSTKYDYTGGEQEYRVNVPGYYKIEVWGAEGGKKSTTYKGGYGGYAKALVKFNDGQIIFINVGGKGGVGNGYTAGVGGYNGGGQGGTSAGSSYASGHGGGGATHIAFDGGLLENLSDKINSILIVSGGGGGNCPWNESSKESLIGGSGGGAIGVSSHINSGTVVSGGTQTSGASFGKGADGKTKSSVSYGAEGSGGGGGGYYGGNTANAGKNSNGGGGGGSGYIGNSLLTDKYMYCYNCETSDEVDTKTYTTTNVSDTPISNYAKSGDGAAIISQITYEKKSNVLEKYPINDIPAPTRDGYKFIGWYTEPNGGTQVTSETTITNKNAHEIYAHWEAAS